MKLHEFHDLYSQLHSALAEPLDPIAIARVRAKAVQARAPRVALRAEREAQVVTFDPEVRYAPEQREASRHAREDAQVLTEGAWEFGISDTRLKEFAGGPGIDALDRLIAQCDAALAEIGQRKAISWPAPHRYIGPSAVADFEGRTLRKGDVVRLTQAQAEAWADRFYLVTEQEAREEQEASAS